MQSKTTHNPLDRVRAPSCAVTRFFKSEKFEGCDCGKRQKSGKRRMKRDRRQMSDVKEVKPVTSP